METVTQSRNYYRDLIPSLIKFYEFYGYYPKRIVADAGYGNLENYSFIKKNKIKNFIKHKSWEGNSSGKNPSQYQVIDNDTIRCLN